MDFSNVCRTCLKNSPNTISIYEDFILKGKKFLFYKLLELFTDLCPTRDDKLTDQICRECAAILRKFEHFRKQCLDSHKVLLKNVMKIKRLEMKENDKKKIIPQFETVDIKVESFEESTKVLEKNKSCDLNVLDEILIKSELLESQIQQFHEPERGIFDDDIEDEQNNNEEIDEIDGDDKEFERETIKLTKKYRKKKRSGLCYVCGKHSSDVKKHMKYHDPSKCHKCDYCEYFFISRASLEVHLTIHTGEKKFACPICGKLFARKNAMNSHIRTHEGATVQCDVCGASYTTKSYLAEHKRTHLAEPQFKCAECSRTFFTKFNYRQHMRSHNPESHPCEFCHRVYETKKTLNRHKKKKHGNSYKCEKCNRFFIKIENYQKHLKVHENIPVKY